MNRLFKIVLLVFVSLPIVGFGQQKVRGVVLNSSNETRVGDVEIRNLRTHDRFVSNTLGLFNLVAELGDTLRVFKEGYNEQNLILSSTEDMIIRLRPLSTQLRTVNVFGQTKEQRMEEVIEQYRKQGSYFDGKPPALAYIFNPISALSETFGKTGRRSRRFQEYMSYEQDQLVVDRKFNKPLIKSLTKLEGEDLDNFVIIYRPSFERARKWNQYDVTNYVIEAFKQFEKNGRPAAPQLPEFKAPDLSESLR